MNKLVKFNDGTVEIHYTNEPNGDKSAALCGQDLAGDHEWGAAKNTRRLVDCKYCLTIVSYCKTL